MILARQQNVILLLLLQKSGHGAMFPKEEVLELATARIGLRGAEACGLRRSALAKRYHSNPWESHGPFIEGLPGPPIDSQIPQGRFEKHPGKAQSIANISMKYHHHSLGPQPGHFWIDDLEVIAMVFGIASLAGDGDAKLVLVHFVLSASLFSLFVVGFMS
jgi:hypothetical protein